MAEVQYRGTGRRKTAIATVRLLPGQGKVMVNGKELEDYFPAAIQQELVKQPLQVTDAEGRFDVVAKVEGGGVSGQAGAVRHGIARALLRVDENNRPQLRKAQLLTRDPRMKERKKYGLKKARRAPQFSKR